MDKAELRWNLIEAIADYGQASRDLGRAIQAGAPHHEWADKDRRANEAHKRALELVFQLSKARG